MAAGSRSESMLSLFGEEDDAKIGSQHDLASREVDEVPSGASSFTLSAPSATTSRSRSSSVSSLFGEEDDAKIGSQHDLASREVDEVPSGASSSPLSAPAAAQATVPAGGIELALTSKPAQVTVPSQGLASPHKLAPTPAAAPPPVMRRVGALCLPANPGLPTSAAVAPPAIRRIHGLCLPANPAPPSTPPTPPTPPIIPPVVDATPAAIPARPTTGTKRRRGADDPAAASAPAPKRGRAALVAPAEPKRCEQRPSEPLPPKREAPKRAATPEPDRGTDALLRQQEAALAAAGSQGLEDPAAAKREKKRRAMQSWRAAEKERREMGGLLAHSIGERCEPNPAAQGSAFERWQAAKRGRFPGVPTGRAAPRAVVMEEEAAAVEERPQGEGEARPQPQVISLDSDDDAPHESDVED